MKAVLIALFWVLWGVTAEAAPLSSPISVGYLELESDPRYAKAPRPFEAAEQAVRESAPALKLVKLTGTSTPSLIERFDGFLSRGMHWFVLDLPSDSVAELSYALRDRDVVLFNLSGEADVLRGAACERNLYDIAPSRRMRSDALAQFLRNRKWNRVLVLEGPQPDDEITALAFRRAARRYGVKVVAHRDFEKGSKAATLLSGIDYDAVYVADADGNFARTLPTTKPLLGATGYSAAARVNWIAQAAVLALAEAIARGGASTTEAVDKQLADTDFTFDARRGTPLSFRAWDHQLRQPMEISAKGTVAATAPFAEFAHATNLLDTLGVDRTETRCHF